MAYYRYVAVDAAPYKILKTHRAAGSVAFSPDSQAIFGDLIFTCAKKSLNNPLGTLIILPLAIVPLVLTIMFKTQIAATFIAFLGFVAVFMLNYRWALRWVGQAVNRKSRKLKQS